MKEYKYQTLEDEETTIYSNEEQNSSNQPFTVEDLKRWIKCQDVPDISKFGLHIGFNSQKTGEAGLYTENGEYILYQNGYDGQKDILYRGPNETFAVRQFIVLFNKEVDSYDRIHRAYEQKNTQKSISKPLIITLVLVLTMMLGAVYLMTRPRTYTYYTDSKDNVYTLLEYYDEDYFKERYLWYKFNPDTLEWEKCEGSISKDSYPTGLFAKELDYLDEHKYGCTYEQISFYNSKIYLTYNNYEPYICSYFALDNELYYYLEDYSSFLDNPDYPSTTGWYHFDKTAKEWKFIGSHDQLKEVNEELWLRHSDNESSYDFYIRTLDEGAEVPIRFEETEFYERYLENTEYYDAYMEDLE